MQRLSAAQVSVRLHGSTDTILLDVREPWELDVASLDGTLDVPMGSVPSVIECGDLQPDDREVVVICHHGVRSLQIAHYLESVGFENVANMEGGIDAWSRTVDTSVPRY